MKIISVTSAIIALTAASLTACSDLNERLRHFPQFFNPTVNIAGYNYGAADALASQSKPDLTLSMPIMIGTLQPMNLKTTEKIPPFGKYTTDQIAGRFIQLGYNVVDSGLNPAEALKMTERNWLETGRMNGAKALLTGNYTISEYDVLVNLRLINLDGGRIFAATDYRVPLGSDTYNLIGRDPYFSLPKKPVNNAEGVKKTDVPVVYAPSTPAPVTRAPLKPSNDLPVRIIP
jgi:TolB-like protein